MTLFRFRTLYKIPSIFDSFSISGLSLDKFDKIANWKILLTTENILGNARYTCLITSLEKMCAFFMVNLSARYLYMYINIHTCVYSFWLLE